MAYITNDGSRLIERARTEGKSIVFGSVRMNTIYKSDPTSLVQQTDEWFGENHGSVVGCISHVSVDEGSKVCDSKLAVQCNDNSESWKSIGIYAHLDGEVDELLFACESIENGEYKDVTIVEIPVTLDGVVADFGLSEGGSGSGGGEVPANMMTTDTDQNGMSGRKEWSYESFYGSGSIDNPKRDDQKFISFATIGCYEGNIQEELISVSSYPEYYNGGEWVSGHGSRVSLIKSGGLRLDSGDTYNDVEHTFLSGESLTITPNNVTYTDQIQETSSATWANIINAANSGGGGGEVPDNMMTTDTVQNGLSGTKTWTWGNFYGVGSWNAPHEGDRRVYESISIDYTDENNNTPLVLNSNESQYSSKEGWYEKGSRSLEITSEKVSLNGSSASWDSIIKVARGEQGFDHASVHQIEGGSIEIGGVQIKPNSEIKIGIYAILVIDSNSKIASVRANGGNVMDVSVAVFDTVSAHRVSGIVNTSAGLSFDAPITPAEGQEIYIHWARYDNNNI